MPPYLKPKLLKISPFLAKFQEKNKSFSRFFSGVEALRQIFDYSSGEEKQSLIPHKKVCSLNSTEVLNTLGNLRTKPFVAFTYFKDCENFGFHHDISTYTTIISILFNWNRRRELMSLFSNFISSKSDSSLQISSIFSSLLQISDDPGLVYFALDALLMACSTCKWDPQEAVTLFFHLVNRGLLPSVRFCNLFLDFLAKTGDVGTLSAFCDQMRGFGINPDVYSFTSLIKSLFNAGKPDDAIQVFDLMEQAGAAPNRLTYLTFLSGLCACNKYDLSCTILLKMIRGVKVTTLDFNMVICGFCKESRLEEAESLVEAMSKQGVLPDQVTYGYLIKAYCEKGNLSKVSDLFEKMALRGLKPTPIIVTHLLQSFHKLGMNKEVLAQFKELKESGMALDKVLYNIVIDAHCRLGLMKGAMELIQEMRIDGLDPDTINYTCLISGFCHKGQVINARKVLAEMIKWGLKPDLFTYHVILRGFCKKGLVNEVFDLLERMSVEGIDPTVDTYCLVIEGFCKGGRVGEAEVMFKVVEQGGSIDQAGQTRLFSSMVSGYLCQHYTARAHELFLRFSQQGNLIDKVSCGRLVRQLCDEGNIGSACNVVNVMRNEHQVVLDEFSYGKLVTAFVQRGEMRWANHWFEDMLKNGVRPNLFIYTSLMNGYCQAQQLQHAHELFVIMKRAGLKPDVVAYTVLLDGHLKEVLEENWSETAKEKIKFDMEAKIDELTRWMAEAEIDPDVIFYTVLIDGACKMDYLIRAEQRFDEMLRKGLTPDVTAYTALIHGYCSQGKIEKAQKLFQKMIDSGLRPDQIAFSVWNKVENRCSQMQMEWRQRI